MRNRLLFLLILVLAFGVFVGASCKKEDSDSSEVVDIPNTNEELANQNAPDLSGEWAAAQVTDTLPQDFLIGAPWSPDEQKLFYEQQEGEISLTTPGKYMIANLASGENITVRDQIEAIDLAYRVKWLDDSTIVYDNAKYEESIIYWTSDMGEVIDELDISEQERNLFSMDFSLDGQRVIYLSDEGIKIASRDNKEAKLILPRGVDDYYYWIRFSPDGRHAATFRNDDVAVIDLEGEEMTGHQVVGPNIVHGRDGGFDATTMILWSPDSRKLVVQDSGSVISLEDGVVAEGLLPYFSINPEEEPIDFNYQWGSDSETIYFMRDENLYRINIELKEEEQLIKGITDFDMHLPSDAIVYTNGKGIYRYSIETGGKEEIHAERGKYSFLKYSPSGEKVAYVLDGDIYILERK